MNEARHTIGCWLLALSIGLFMTGCSTEPVSREPSVDLPDTFSSSGEAPTPDRWWRSFDDPKLNQLISSSLKGNLNVKTAWDRLAQSMAVARREGAALYPEIEGTGSASRDVSDSEGGADGTIVGGSLVGGGGGRSYSNEYTLSFNANYELDLWGRVRAALEAEEQNVKASRQDVHATALSVSAQVADVWYRLVEQRAQRKLLREQIQTNKQYLELIRRRFEQGAASSSDVLQQQNLVESTRTQQHRIQAQINTLKHQLAVLQGKVPEQVSLPAQSTLPDLPARPQTGIPMHWLRKRPDIRRAFHRVKSADRELAAAIANRFPRLTIVPRFRTDAPTPSDLFNSWTARLMSNLVLPIIDGGRRKAEVERSRAVKKERVHNYTQTILTGIQEVEDALSNEVQQKQQIKSLQDQIERSKRTVDQLVVRYRNGNVDYLRVLDEIRNRQQLQRDLLSARGQLVRFRIDLYETLGGSWNLPVPDDVPEPLSSTDGKSIHHSLKK